MKVAQLRKLLEEAAAVYERTGPSQDADALRRLAEAIREADTQTVAKLVQRLGER